MKVLVQANLLTVGVDDKLDILGQLPIRVYSADTAAEAIGLLRNEKFKGVCSRW
jgi:hypothetical protein